MGVAMQGTLVFVTDEAKATEAQGKRHFVKQNRWVVLSDPDGLLKGTWLTTAQARQMLLVGDFYLDGTVILIMPEQWQVRVEGKKIFHCETGVEVKP